MKKTLRSTSGMGLVSGMIVLVIISISLMAMLSMTDFLRRAERGVTSNSDLTNTMITLRLILETPGSCAKSGLVGITLNPDSPGANPITIHMPGQSGPAEPYLAEGMIAGTSRAITSLRISELRFLEDWPPGKSYLATLELQTAVLGRAMTQRNPNAKLNLKLVLDAGNRVAECYAATPASYRSTSGSAGDRPSTGGISCTRVSSGWSRWPLRQTKTATCPAGHRGVTCMSDFYDNNGIVYHGAMNGRWNTDRTSCSATSGDGGISEGQVTAECCSLE